MNYQNQQLQQITFKQHICVSSMRRQSSNPIRRSKYYSHKNPLKLNYYSRFSPNRKKGRFLDNNGRQTSPLHNTRLHATFTNLQRTQPHFEHSNIKDFFIPSLNLSKCSGSDSDLGVNEDLRRQCAYGLQKQSINNLDSNISSINNSKQKQKVRSYSDQSCSFQKMIDRSGSDQILLYANNLKKNTSSQSSIAEQRAMAAVAVPVAINKKVDDMNKKAHNNKQTDKNQDYEKQQIKNNENQYENEIRIRNNSNNQDENENRKDHDHDDQDDFYQLNPRKAEHSNNEILIFDSQQQDLAQQREDKDDYERVEIRNSNTSGDNIISATNSATKKGSSHSYNTHHNHIYSNNINHHYYNSIGTVSPANIPTRHRSNLYQFTRNIPYSKSQVNEDHSVASMNSESFVVQRAGYFTERVPFNIKKETNVNNNNNNNVNNLAQQNKEIKSENVSFSIESDLSIIQQKWNSYFDEDNEEADQNDINEKQQLQGGQLNKKITNMKKLDKNQEQKDQQHQQQQYEEKDNNQYKGQTQTQHQDLTKRIQLLNGQTSPPALTSQFQEDLPSFSVPSCSSSTIARDVQENDWIGQDIINDLSSMPQTHNDLKKQVLMNDNDYTKVQIVKASDTVTNSQIQTKNNSQTAIQNNNNYEDDKEKQFNRQFTFANQLNKVSSSSTDKVFVSDNKNQKQSKSQSQSQFQQPQPQSQKLIKNLISFTDIQKQAKNKKQKLKKPVAAGVKLAKKSSTNNTIDTKNFLELQKEKGTNSIVQNIIVNANFKKKNRKQYPSSLFYQEYDKQVSENPSNNKIDSISTFENNNKPTNGGDGIDCYGNDNNGNVNGYVGDNSSDRIIRFKKVDKNSSAINKSFSQTEKVSPSMISSRISNKMSEQNQQNSTTTPNTNYVSIKQMQKAKKREIWQNTIKNMIKKEKLEEQIYRERERERERELKQNNQLQQNTISQFKKNNNKNNNSIQKRQRISPNSSSQQQFSQQKNNRRLHEKETFSPPHSAQSYSNNHQKLSGYVNRKGSYKRRHNNDIDQPNTNRTFSSDSKDSDSNGQCKSKRFYQSQKSTNDHYQTNAVVVENQKYQQPGKGQAPVEKINKNRKKNVVQQKNVTGVGAVDGVEEVQKLFSQTQKIQKQQKQQKQQKDKHNYQQQQPQQNHRKQILITEYLSPSSSSASPFIVSPSQYQNSESLLHNEKSKFTAQKQQKNRQNENVNQQNELIPTLRTQQEENQPLSRKNTAKKVNWTFQQRKPSMQSLQAAKHEKKFIGILTTLERTMMNIPSELKPVYNKIYEKLYDQSIEYQIKFQKQNYLIEMLKMMIFFHKKKLDCQSYLTEQIPCNKNEEEQPQHQHYQHQRQQQRQSQANKQNNIINTEKSSQIQQNQKITQQSSAKDTHYQLEQISLQEKQLQEGFNNDINVAKRIQKKKLFLEVKAHEHERE